MRIARVRLFSLFGAMLFLLNLLTSNVIYHNICILSTLILRNLMYLKSIDELPAPFPLPAFITFHRLSIPSVAFQCLPSPFITLHRLHYLSSPPHLIVRPLSAPPFCPRLAQLSRHAPAFPRFTHLLPSCVITPFCFTHPSFTHHCLRPFALLFPIVLRPLFYSLPLCFIYSRCFAPVFLLPGNLRKPVAGTAKGNVFLIFQRNFAKSP